MLVRMCRNWNSCALLVGMENGAASVENRMVVPQKLKNRITIWSSNSTFGYTYPKELKAGSEGNTCTPVFRAALFTTAKR